MSMVTRPRIDLLRLLVIAIALTACDEAVGVDGEFDAAATTETMEAMSDVGSQSEAAFASMAVAGPQVFEGTSSGALLPSDDGLMTAASTERFIALQSQPFFPSNFLGVTFVYSEGEGRFVASDETGAPADGVRIIYYAVDPISDRPASPLNALGYVDLRDLSTAASDRISLRVLRTSGATDVTLADFHVDAVHTATATEASIALSAPGYLSDGVARLNFDLNQSVLIREDGVIEIDQDHEMSLADSDLSVAFTGHLVTNLEAQTLTYDMTSTITGDGNSVVVDALLENESLDGEIRYNAETVAFIGGTVEAPEFTASNGEPFEAGEHGGLRNLFEAVQSLIDLADGIFSSGDRE